VPPAPGCFIFAAGFTKALDLSWQRRQAWKVGVVRYRAPGGVDRPIRRGPQEVLPPGEEPTERIADLVAKVRSRELDENA
jgi:hypothetical protein